MNLPDSVTSHNILAKVCSQGGAPARRYQASLNEGVGVGARCEEGEALQGCIRGNQHRLPIPQSEAKRANEILGIVHSDVNGPMNNTSLGSAKYFITFIDDKTRKAVVYFLKSKDEVFA